MRRWSLVLGVSFAMATGAAQADSIYIPLSGRNASSVIDRIAVADAIVVTGEVPTAGNGAITHILKFVAPAAALRATVTWSIFSKTRFVGVNVDLLDSGNTVVASDLFQGVAASRVAVSTLDVETLTPNKVYLLKVTGTQITTLNYSITMEFGL